MRRASALLITAGLLLASLSACSSNPAGSGCESTTTSGNASKLISATGHFGSAPKATFPTPVKSSTTQRSEIIDGSGALVHKNQKVDLDWSIYNATTGALITKTSYKKNAKNPLTLNSQTLKGLVMGLQCTTVGSRVAIVIPPKDAYGSKGNPQIGLGPTDSMIALIDVRRAYLMRADGAPQPRQPGFPSVVLAPSGEPGISVTGADAPTTAKVAVLKRSNGKIVKKGDSVTINYLAVDWQQKSVTSSTWSTHSPVSVLTGKDPQKQNTVPQGVVSAIIGKKVGSQIIAIIPTGAATKSTPADATVYVIDILGID